MRIGNAEPAAPAPGEKALIQQRVEARLVDDTKLLQRLSRAIGLLDVNPLRDQKIGGLERLAEGARKVELELEGLAELSRLAREGRRHIALEQAPPALAGHEILRRLVDRQHHLVRLGAVREDEGIAADIGWDVDAGAPAPVGIDENDAGGVVATVGTSGADVTGVTCPDFFEPSGVREWL